jgi:glycosyltransferase involved in cell wall biosynthesis
VKVLYAFPEPLPLPRARGLQAVNTVEALAAAGVEILLAHAPPADRASGDPFAFYEVPRRANARSLTVSRALAWPLGRIHSNRLFLSRLARHIESEKPHVAFVRHIKLAALLRARFPSLPIVYEAHEVFGDTAESDNRQRADTDERAALSAASAVVANSHGTARRLAERYAYSGEITVVPNAVERPSSLPSKDWARAREKIVYAGSLFPWKGVADLVAAAAELPGCGITIAGGDPGEIEALKRVAAEDGARVAFVGRIDHGRVRALLEASCIAVLPNRADAESAFTSPLKLFEYMAAGCALVASDLPALRELLGEDDAVFVRPGDPRSLAAGVRALAEDPARASRMGERLFDKTREFTWQRRGERLVEVLERAAN